MGFQYFYAAIWSGINNLAPFSGFGDIKWKTIPQAGQTSGCGLRDLAVAADFINFRRVVYGSERRFPGIVPNKLPNKSEILFTHLL